MTCKCAKRIAKLERDVTRLRAQLPKEIHHAVRTEIRVERKVDTEAAYFEAACRNIARAQSVLTLGLE